MLHIHMKNYRGILSGGCMRMAGEACGSSQVCPEAEPASIGRDWAATASGRKSSNAQRGGAERVLARNTEINEPPAPSEADSTDTAKRRAQPAPRDVGAGAARLAAWLLLRDCLQPFIHFAATAVTSGTIFPVEGTGQRSWSSCQK